MRKAVRLLDRHFEEVVGCLVLAAVVTLTFVGVIARLAFNSGLPWQEELTRMLFVVMIYVGASYAIARNDHIRVTVIYGAVGSVLRRLLDILADVAAIGFQWVLAWMAFAQMLSMREFPASSAVLQVPLYLIFAVVPVMFAVMSVRQIQRLVLHLRGGEDEFA